jgi:uncharacterized protein (DUF2267 family)
MQSSEFYQTVQRRARLDDTEQARSAAEATLRTLAERIAEGEARNVADQLPDELGAPVAEASDGGTDNFGISEFFERVADRESDRESVDPQDAELHAQAATDALSQAISTGQLDDVLAQLPSEYDALFETLDGGEEPY